MSPEKNIPQFCNVQLDFTKQFILNLLLSLYVPRENIRKPEAFCFQVVAERDQWHEID